MNVLLINSPYRTRGVPPIMPVQLANLGSFLKDRGHGAEVVDLNLRSMAYLAERLRTGAFDLAAISYRNVAQAYWFEQFRGLKKLVDALKSYGAKNMIIGGAGFSLFYPLIFERVPKLSAGVLGEGEHALFRFAEGDAALTIPGFCSRTNDGIRTGGPPRILSGGEIPCFRDIDGLDYAHPSYLVGFQSYRGCTYNCSYCPVEFMHGRGIALRPMESVEEDLKFLRAKSVRHLFVLDGAFNAPFDRSRTFAESMIGLGYPDTWEGFIKPRPEVDEDYLRLLARSGAVRFHIDVLSMTERIGPLIGHGLAPDEVFRVARLLRTHGIEAVFYFSYLLPGEKLTDEAQTIRQMRAIRKIGHRTYIWPFFSYPGTGSEKFYGKIIEKKMGWHIIRMARMMIRPSFFLFLKNFLTFAKSTGPRRLKTP